MTQDGRPPEQPTAHAVGEPVAGVRPVRPVRSFRERIGRLGLRSRMVLVVVLAVLPMLGLVVARAGMERERVRDDAIAEVQRLAALAGLAEERVLDRARDLAVTLAALPDVRSLDPERCDPVVKSMLAAHESFVTNVIVTDAPGLVVCSATPLSGPVSLGDRAYFRRAVETRALAVGEYAVGRITGQPLVSVALPIVGPDGTVEGVIVNGLSLDALGEIGSEIALPAGATLTMVDREGTILVRTLDPQAWIGRTVPDATLVEALLAGGEGTIEAVGLDGVSRLYAYHPVGADLGAGFHLAIGFDAATVYAEADRSLGASLAWLLLVLVLALILVQVGSRALILRPVESLLDASRRLTAGDLASRTSLAGTGGELGQLANAFDEMAASVEQRVDERTGELRRALDTVARSEERVRAYLDASRDGILILDPIQDETGAVADFRITYASELEAIFLGRPADELLGQRLLDVLPGLRATDRFAGWVRVLETGRPIDLFDRELQPQEGREPRSFDYRVARIGDGLAVHARDVTEQVRAAHEVERLLAEVQDLYENAPTGYHATGADTLVTRINATELRWLGYERDEVVGLLHAIDLYAPASAERFPQLQAQVFERGFLPDAEMEMRRKDGSTFPVLVRVAATTDAAGRVIGTRVGVIDISARREAELELERSRAELDRFFDLSPDVFVVTGQSGRFERINDALARLLGYPPEVILSRPWDEFVHPDDRARSAAEFAREVEQGHRTIAFSNRYVSAEGSVHWMEWNAQLDPDAGVVYGIARDVTDRNAAEAALREARAEAEGANRAKSEFLSRMSHELRTPLNSIIGFAQLLGMDHLDEDQRESADQILRSGRHLLDLINEVLDISRIEAGELSLSLEPVGVHDAVADAVALIRPLAAARGIVIHVEEIAPERHVLADRQRLKQVLLNLLSNAVKYNRPAGTIRIACGPAGTGMVRLGVTDEGQGIPQALQVRLFAPFDRLGAEGGTAEGTGLGLTLSRALVEHMEGRLGVDSSPGVGSTFWVELPETEPPTIEHPEEPSAPAPAEPTPGPAAAGTVLYIEDNLSNFRLVERALALRGAVRLLPAMLGSLGLELAREHHPDLVLLDLHLPDMAGEELLARLRADPATAAIPVVVLSADATPGQVDRLAALGARAYLTKPLDLAELLALVDDVLAPSGEG